MKIFLDTMRFDCSSVASTDVTTFLLPIDYVQELLQSSFTFVRQIASDLAEQLQHTHVILNDAQTHAAIERLARYLMVVSEQQLYRSGIQQAATAIGGSYRHAWRLFQELLQDGTLEKEGRAYRIANTRQLLRLASLTG